MTAHTMVPGSPKHIQTISKPTGACMLKRAWLVVAETVLSLLLFLSLLKQRTKQTTLASISFLIAQWKIILLCTAIPSRDSRIREKSPSRETQERAAGPSCSTFKGQRKSPISNRKAKNQRKARKTKREPNDDEDEPPSDPQHSGDDNNNPDGELMACHFFKFDPIKHHACGTKILRGFSRVKQHLKRDHGLGNFHCQSCWTVFKGAELHDQHTSASCERVSFALSLQRLSAEEMSQLDQVPPNVAVTSKWYWVWDKFFSGHQRPQSPFIQDGVAKFEEPIRQLAHHGLRGVQACLLRHRIGMTPHQASNFIHDLISTIMSTPQLDLPVRDRTREPGAAHRLPTRVQIRPDPNTTTQNQQWQPPNLGPGAGYQLGGFPQHVTAAENMPAAAGGWAHHVSNVMLPEAVEQVGDSLQEFPELSDMAMEDPGSHLQAMGNNSFEFISAITDEGEHFDPDHVYPTNFNFFNNGHMP